MRKIRLFFLAAVLLFSSCKFAHSLNEMMGLKAPEDKNILTVFADFESSNYFLIDLGDSFAWNRSKITFNKLMENEEFTKWYLSLKKDNWDQVGLYVPDSDLGLLNGDRDFYLSKGTAMIVGWNDPFDHIRIRANNFTDKYYDYFFSETYSYDAVVSLEYLEVCKNGNFSIWVGDLGSTVQVNNYSVDFTPVGFTKTKATVYNYDSLENVKTIDVNKWQIFVNLGWIPRKVLAGFSIYANTYSDDPQSFYVALDDVYEYFDVSWNYLSQNEAFISWYNSLSKPGYGTIGMGPVKDESWIYISEKSPDSTYRVNSYDRLYVIWSPELSYVKIHANNGKRNYYEFPLPKNTAALELTWNMLERNDDFMVWYKALSNHADGIYTKGLSNYADDKDPNIYQYSSSSSTFVSSGNEDLYVIYGSYSNNYGIGLHLGDNLYIKTGESVQVKYWTNSGFSPSVKSIAFETDNPFVADVDAHGLITGKSEGEVKIKFIVTTYSGQIYSTEDTFYVCSNPAFNLMKKYKGYTDYYSVSDDGKVHVYSTGSRFGISTDSGATFIYRTIDDGRYIYRLVLSHSGNSIAAIVYVDTTKYGIYYSTDYGETFKYLTTLNDIPSELVISDDGKTVGYCLNIFRDTRLEIIHNGSEYYSYPGFSIYENKIAMSSSGKYISVSKDDGVWYSDDYGKSFNPVTTTEVYCLRMTSDGETLFYNSILNNYIVNRMRNSVVVGQSQIESTNFYVSADGNGMLYIDDYDRYIRYSNDSGKTWEIINQKLPSYDMKFIVTNNFREIYLIYGNSIYRWRGY